MRASALVTALALAAAPATAWAQAAATGVIPPFWRTRAERTDYRQTGDYDETVRFCRRLEASSGLAKVLDFGRTGQGRPLVAVVLARDRAFTPEQARATGRPIVLVQNGIHAGEIEGKDACLELMRDILVTKTRERLLDSAIVIVIPVFSADAHERRSRWNRINQNGPEEMGWRHTPIGLNLNRDYLKAEAPEMRALLGLFTRWWPHLLVDDHTTNGADYRHDVTWSYNHGPTVPRPVQRWLVEAFEGRVVPRLTAMGHLPAPYLDFRRANDPASGVEFGATLPRFSTGYSTLQCRPGILVETHMLKPYASRVRATYDLLVALLEEVNARPRALTGAVAEAEAEVVSAPRGTVVALTSALVDSGVPFAYRGLRTRWETSDIVGARVPRYGAEPWDTTIAVYRTLRPERTATRPAGYVVPQEWTAAIERLAIHGVTTRRLARGWRDTVETARVVAWTVGRPFEGHRPLDVGEVRLERRVRGFRPGDVWVPLDQRSALVAMHLLEARAPDGLLHWNYFDTVLEPKEYAESYVMEPIARRMLAENPALAREFEAKLKSDSAFAASPQARVDFFFRRSSWADPEQQLHPVERAMRAPPADALAR
jgi:hypothetical protein